jgi:Fe-Mn family superoxide dismutase
MAFKLTPLPYPKDALEPHISAETLEFHHGKHHKSYVDKLNAAIEGGKYEDMSLEEIITATEDGDIFNNAAQVWNHTFYWHCMDPSGGGNPGDVLADAINRDFDSVAAFKEEFTEAVESLFGSGWVWLVADSSGKLSIEKKENAHNPLGTDSTALLTCDTWEHAFYIDYRNDKGGYMDAFWKVVNWTFAANNLKTVQS